MTLERPDLSQLSPEIKAYIEALEAELNQLREAKPEQSSKTGPVDLPLEPSEPPTTINIITVSREGQIKRTPRHLYSRQRRGGMGIFDLELPESDPPTGLVAVDLTEVLLVVTNQARAFRLPVEKIPESPVRSRGKALDQWLDLNKEEQVSLVLPIQTSGYANIVTQRGHVRRFRYHIFKESMVPGTPLYDLRELGPPMAACWGPGDADLLIATRQGRAIRFDEQQVSTRGCLGIRLDGEDQVVAIATVTNRSRVFLLSADGKGIIRHMSGFSPNKAPGSGGKIALKSDHLVTALTVNPFDDLFVISRLSKIIRFQASEVSTTEGVVQGVNCIALRADEVVATGNSLSLTV